MHPDGQDIFGEVDWMEGHRMEERPRNLVIRALGRHDITLHIDVMPATLRPIRDWPASSETSFLQMTDAWKEAHQLRLLGALLKMSF